MAIHFNPGMNADAAACDQVRDDRLTEDTLQKLLLVAEDLFQKGTGLTSKDASRVLLCHHNRGLRNAEKVRLYSVVAQRCPDQTASGDPLTTVAAAIEKQMAAQVLARMQEYETALTMLFLAAQ